MTSPMTPYSTAVPYFQGSVPSWLPQTEVERIRSYKVYEDIYWNNPDSFKLVQRGTDGQPIYVPCGKVVVETINRYVAKDLDFTFLPDFGTDAERDEAQLALTALFNRERFWSKFAAAKRFGIIKGDWILHITADEAKVQGSRIKITFLDPANFFPITDPDDVDTMIGCDIAEAIIIEDNTYVKRHRYVRNENGTIQSSLGVFEQEGWNTDKAKPVPPKGVVEPFDLTLPAEITALPVYHIKNFEQPKSPFGSSELRGIERLIAGVNQSASDEEITLAMEGLGVYTTTAGSPVDENGQDVPWRIGPGRVVELPEGSEFDRVNGVNTVGPYQGHLDYLHKQIDLGTGASSIAKGDVDVQVAESGIALALRFAPIMDLAAEKDILIKDILRQFIFDLRQWLKVFEGVNCDNVLWEPTFGPKLPRDLEKEAQFWIDLATAAYISIGTLHEKLRELGYDIPQGELATMIAEQNTLAEAGLGAAADDSQQQSADLQAEAQGATEPPAE